MIIETERLTLRPWTLDDKEALFEIVKNPKVALSTGFYTYTESDQCIFTIEKILSGPECYAICLKGTNTPIGNIELMLNEDKTEGELGFYLKEECWGNAYMKEAALALMERGFTVYNLTKMNCSHFLENERSGKAQQKMGFKYVKTVENVKRCQIDDTCTMVYNELTREDWLNNNR